MWPWCLGLGSCCKQSSSPQATLATASGEAHNVASWYARATGQLSAGPQQTHFPSQGAACEGPAVIRSGSSIKGDSPLLVSILNDLSSNQREGLATFHASQSGVPLFECQSLLGDVKLIRTLPWLAGQSSTRTYEGFWRRSVKVAAKLAISRAQADDQASGACLLPAALVLEAIASKNLSHPHIVPIYDVRFTQLSVEFFAACQCETQDVDEQAHTIRAVAQQHIMQPDSPEALQAALEKAQQLLQQWHGSTPLSVGLSCTDADVRPSYRPSNDGFGLPPGWDNGPAIPWSEVLQALAAQPGDFVAVLLMKLCDLGTLDTAVQNGMFHARATQPAASEPRVWDQDMKDWGLVRTLKEVAQALEHLHECGVVHGDLKASHVHLLSSRMDDRGFTAQLSGFGLARLARGASTAAWQQAGSLQYVAPELLAASGDVLPPTCESDAWSFGLLMWSATTGKQPFQDLDPDDDIELMWGTQAPAWPHDRLTDLAALYNRCICEEPSVRPTAREIVLALLKCEQRLLCGTPAASTTSSPS